MGRERPLWSRKTYPKWGYRKAVSRDTLLLRITVYYKREAGGGMVDDRVLKSMRIDKDLMDFIQWYGVTKRTGGFSHSMRMILAEAMSGMSGEDRHSLALYLREQRKANEPAEVDADDKWMRACPSCGSSIGFAHYHNGDWACQLCGTSGTTA